MSNTSERRGIQSVEIAFRLLTALQADPQAQPLKEVARRAGLTPSAANNYLVSLVRTGLAAADARPGHYRLGPSSLALGVSAMQQIDGFEVVRTEVVALCAATGRSTAVTAWSEDGPISLFKADGEALGAFVMRTGLIPIMSTAAGKVFAALLPAPATTPLLAAECRETSKTDAQAFRSDALRELKRKRYSLVQRADDSGYVSIAAPVWDWQGEPRFALSIVGSRSSLQIDKDSPQVRALLESAARSTAAIGGKPMI
jgi:DNA-binding IclR family transcriptional regulator